MAGLGGCLGYFLGGIPWEHTFLTKLLGDHIHVLFTLVWMVYIICMILTLTASKEPTGIAIMAPYLSRSASHQHLVSSYSINSMQSLSEGMSSDNENTIIKRERYGSTSIGNIKISYLDYLRSIIYMPSSLRWLCLTNFFCWMAIVSYSLFFTDFVGQAVFGEL
jgi:solute carrier family 45 protein 1/2/4